MKKIVTFGVCFFSLIIINQLFAANATDTNWKDLLLKSFNFFVLVGGIWFFFGKKIILSLKEVVKSEHDDFFTLEKKKQELERKSQELQKNIENVKVKAKEDEVIHFRKIDLEIEKIKKEAEDYKQKIEKNNSIILEQEWQSAKQKLYRRIFEKALGKLEQAIYNKEIIVSQDKYLTKFFYELKQNKK